MTGNFVQKASFVNESFDDKLQAKLGFFQFRIIAHLLCFRILTEFIDGTWKWNAMARIKMNNALCFGHWTDINFWAIGDGFVITTMPIIIRKDVVNLFQHN